MFARGRRIIKAAWSGQATHAVAGQLERVVRPRRRRAAHSVAGRRDRSAAAKRRGACPGRRARLNREALASANGSANKVARESANVDVHLRGLTFELSGRRRQDARPALAKMYRVPPDRAWWPAVGAPLERRVRPRRNE